MNIRLIKLFYSKGGDFMLLTSGRGQNTFIEDLRNNLVNAKIVYIITAYITVGGLVDILPQIQNCQEVCIIVGDMSNKYCMELQMQLMGAAPPAKKHINEIPILQQMVQSKRLKILFARDDKAKIIHSKGYLLELWSGGFVTYVGSANLTHPGFFQNKEWMLKSTDVDTANHVYREFLNEWQVLSNQYMNVQDLNQVSMQQGQQVNNQGYGFGYSQNMQGYQNNQMGGFNGLGQDYLNNGGINIGIPNYNYNLQNNTYIPDSRKGVSIGSIDGQDLRIGEGELLRFLKSLF